MGVLCKFVTHHRIFPALFSFDQASSHSFGQVCNEEIEFIEICIIGVDRKITAQLLCWESNCKRQDGAELT